MLCVFERLSLKKTYQLFQTRRKWTCDYNNISMTFPKLLWFEFFSMTFPGLGMTILKFHDFSRFSMTVRTLIVVTLGIPELCIEHDNFYLSDGSRPNSCKTNDVSIGLSCTLNYFVVVLHAKIADNSIFSLSNMEVSRFSRFIFF